VKLYFYNNKAFGSGGNTYRQPASYTVQYNNGTDWVDVPSQQQSPSAPAPNLNDVTFSPVVTRQLRVVMTRPTGFAVGVKEIQAFSTPPRACTNTLTGTQNGPITVTGVTCLADATVSGPVTVRPGGTLVAGGSTIRGPLSANGAADVLIGNTSISGPVSISGTTGSVTIDDESSVNGPVTITGSGGAVAVAGSQVSGPVSVNGNTGSTVVAANAIGGPLACSDNAPPPTNLGDANTVTGPSSGQCSGL
jgi:hypothetical protein